KALQDWVLEREFRTVPRIVDVTSFGGTVRRYEVQPDPDRLRRYGVTLPQLQSALTNSNATVGGDYVNQGQVAFTVRNVGLFGGGKDPVHKVLGFETRQLENVLANSRLSDEEKDRLRAGMSRRKVDPAYPESFGPRSLLTWFDRLAGKKVDFPLTDQERQQICSIEQRAALEATRILRAEERRRTHDIR